MTSQLSPLERLKVAHQARQEGRTPLDLPLWPDGSLIARIGTVDVKAAGDVTRTLMRLVTDEVGDLTDRDLAGVIVGATRSLHVPGDDGLEPLTDDTGKPLTFGPSLAAALGNDKVTDPIDAARFAFVVDGEVDAARMLSVAMRIAGWVLGDDEDPR